MIDFGPANAMDDVWQYGLFEALYGRRSRRFGLGFEITEGPLQYKSHEQPVPLSELEEALLVAAGGGITGTPLWDMGRPVARGVGDGRTHGSTTAGGRRTALFFTNDDGVYYTSGKRGPKGPLRGAAWSPEGKRVVFHKRLTALPTTWKKIWSRNPDYELTLTGILPSFSPEGGRFVMTGRPPAGSVLGSSIAVAARSPQAHRFATS